METLGRASATQINKVRLVGLFLELLCCFYQGKLFHLYFYHPFLMCQRRGRVVRGAGLEHREGERVGKKQVFREAPLFPFLISK